ncbi:MAG: ArsR family transcriptional regulator [Anaerolineae bacterium]|jgi:predicted ArsR family transcriptional regulator
MQATRERILNILKEQGQATVKELSETLDLTTVTIRHHLDTLRRENLVAPPTVRHRKAPGRPQHVYALTQEASDFFPKRYERLIALMFEEIHSRMSREELERMMESIGQRMVAGVTVPDNADFEKRVAIAVGFMDERGYMAHWEKTEDGSCLVHVTNCPYEGVAQLHSEVCRIDCTLLTELLGPTLGEISRQLGPARHCTYVVRPAGD